MSSREESMKENGSFNRYHGSVHAEVFKTNLFFDKKDLVQVKYEMLRAVLVDGGNVKEVADSFGFSRKTYYLILHAFEEGGLNALMPKKRGPKGPNKLVGEVSEFIERYAAIHRNAKAKVISEQLEAALGVRIHPRTIERYFEKKINLWDE